MTVQIHHLPNPADCTPPKTVAVVFCVKAYMEICHFRESLYND